MSVSTVICFGEVLWDCLPKGLFAGGAPINVAYHLSRFGLDARPATAVGKDFLGEELLRRFRYWDLSPEFVSRVEQPTGAVIAELDSAGVASYRFLDDVAWDHIPLTDSLKQLAPKVTALVFGTLAQRADSNRAHLAELRGRASTAKQIYDVNLRPPFDSPALVWELARGCDLIKLNDDELGTLLDLDANVHALEDAARQFSKRTQCDHICVTAGKHGAGLLWEGSWTFDPPQPIEVKDTVGAGDSFLAALVHGWLVLRLSPADNLQRAARVAEFVATRDGATPLYKLDANGYPVSA